MSRSVKVAVIGAGVSGLVAARELQRERNDVVVFEKNHRLGGTWVYDPRTDSDPLSLDPTREVVHSSLYFSLRANLPRQLMSFLDYPFSKRETGDPRTFPGHEEVLRFLEEFAGEFGINELIRFGTEVVKVEREGKEWVVESKRRNRDGDSVSREVFEAVVVCSGHFVEPKLGEVPGIERWRGFQMHCHNYRVPQPFQDQGTITALEKTLAEREVGFSNLQEKLNEKETEASEQIIAFTAQVVILIGLGPSSFDISREIASVAKEVHVAVKPNPDLVGILKLHDCGNIKFHTMIKCVYENGSVAFEDGFSVYADAIVHCTGYRYHFPFLETNGIVTVEDNRVGPLYKHVFPPALAPWLSFIGLTFKDHVFHICDLQSKWVSGVLSGKVILPTEEEMMESVQNYYQLMEEKGLPKRYTHSLRPLQVDYKHWLAAEIGVPPLEDWRDAMLSECYKNLVEMNDKYRDEWDDAYWDAIIQSSSAS